MPYKSLATMSSYSFDVRSEDYVLCIYDNWGCTNEWYYVAEDLKRTICHEPKYKDKFSFRIARRGEYMEVCKNVMHLTPGIVNNAKLIKASKDGKVKWPEEPLSLSKRIIADEDEREIEEEGEQVEEDAQLHLLNKLIKEAPIAQQNIEDQQRNERLILERLEDQLNKRQQRRPKHGL